MKKLKDIKAKGKSKPIDLSSPEKKRKKEAKRIKKPKHSISKKQTPIHKVRDIKGTEESHYSYFRANKLQAPKFLGNLLKIGLIGLSILLIINSINVYSNGKKLENQMNL